MSFLTFFNVIVMPPLRAPTLKGGRKLTIDFLTFFNVIITPIVIFVKESLAFFFEMLYNKS